MKWAICFAFLFLLGCQEMPESLKKPVYKKAVLGDALWLSVRTGSSGKLMRYDTSDMSQTEVQSDKISSDVILLPDSENTLFMLTRINSDSLQLIEAPTGQVIDEIPMEKGDLSNKFPVPFNPQFATRDSQNRVWVAGQNCNSLYIYDSQLNHIEYRIDLEDLGSNFSIEKDGSDHYLEPAILISPNQDEMVLFIQKLRRYYNDTWDWVPTETSTMVVFNINDFAVRTIKEIPISNPIKSFLIETDGWPSLKIVGAGSMNQYPIMGSIMEIETKGYTTTSLQNFDYKILDASYNPNSGIAYIAWNTDQEYSCLVINEVENHCQKAPMGYIYNKIAIDDKKTYVSQMGYGSSTLLLVDHETEEIQSLTIMGIIESMIIGQ